MGREELKRNSNQSFNTNTGNVHEAVSYGNSGNQQLRNNQQEEIYKSDERRHVYQNHSQSFNAQREQYAEQALNNYQSGYDYQAATVFESGSNEEGSHFQRYTMGRESGVGGAATDSIFAKSDYDLANATGDYLSPNSEKFNSKIIATENKLAKAEGKISDLETYGLEYRNSYKFWKHRLILDDKKNFEATAKLFHKDVKTVHKDHIVGERVHKTEKTQIAGRLKFQSEKIAITEKKHNKEMGKEERRFDRRLFFAGRAVGNIKGNIKNTANGASFQEDEEYAEMKRKAKKAMRGTARGLGFSAKRNYRRMKHELDAYNRLKFQNARLASLRAQNARLAYRSGIDLQKRKAAEAARQGFLREKSKRKIKKEMIRNYKKEQGNFFVRNIRQHRLKKTVKKEKRMAIKRIRTLLSSFLGLLFVVLITILIVVFFIVLLMDAAGETYSNSVSQNDYYDMTDVTAYFREKEATLEEQIKPENLEPIILHEYPDIYEFVYDMDEISFDANTLVAYLSAKYNEFDLALVQADLDEAFEQYYDLKWEVKEEDKFNPVTNTMEKVKICYVKLEKADFFQILLSRIDDEAKRKQMEAFYLTGNGQQVYGPVMQEDWRNKISSNYGWRIHPLTGVRTFHDGVDIAIPTGTALYSPVEGTVVRSFYSDSGGNMIVIKNSSGWEITFMHMDSRTVQAGDDVLKGQRVGYSGNTGNSTGPHLHLQIHDASGNSVNPVFLVPFSTTEESGTF